MANSVRVVMNEKSGGCAGRRTEIEAAFRAHELECRIVPCEPRLSFADLDAGPGTVVVAAGGDGTVNTTASMLLGTTTCMGVLALGTLNHFAKDLGLPLEVQDAAAVIADGKPKAVDVGEVNGRIFVNNSSLGFYPGMVVEREKMKRSGRNKWFSLAVASVRAFLRFRRLSLLLTLPPERPGAQPRRLRRRTPFLFVGNNEYVLRGTEAGTRERLDGGKLHLALAPGATRWSLARLSLAMLRHKIHEAENFESFCVAEFTVETGRRTSRVSLDGEVVRMKGTLRYRARPGALHVMTPGKDAA